MHAPIRLRKIGAWLALLASILVYLAVFQYPHERHLWGDSFTLAGLLEAVAWLMACHIVGLIARVNFERRQAAGNVHLPAILLHFVLGLLYIITVLIIIGNVFEQDIRTLIATSGAVSIFVGFVLRDTILDFFTGFSLNLDETLEPGSLIRIHLRSDKEYFGTVMNISWRATSIKTVQDETVILPNRELGFASIIQPTQPRKSIEATETIQFDYRADLQQVMKSVQDAMEQITLDKKIVRDPGFHIRLDSLDRDGISIVILFQYDPFIYSPSAARHEVLSALYIHLKAAHVLPLKPVLVDASRNRVDSVDTNRDLRRLLQSVELFSWLEPDVHASIASRCVLQFCESDHAVVVENEPGDTMYMIAAGLATVEKQTASGTVQLAVLGPGDYFGEMSLLTGKQRLATVITRRPSILYEISKAAITPVLEADQRTAATLSQIVICNRDRHEKTLGAQVGSDQENLSHASLLKKIADYFDLRAPH